MTFTDPGDPLREVDVPIPARELVSRAQRLESKELELRVVCLDDLIRLERAAARPQDLADVAHLERLASRGRA